MQQSRFNVMTSLKNNLIYITKQEGLYQNKVNSSLASIHNCKMAYFLKSFIKKPIS